MKEFSINFGNFLLSLSDAIDLANPHIASHQMRTAFICWELGRAAGLSKEQIKNLFVAALFHDIGALSLEEKIILHDFEVKQIDAHCVLGAELFSSSSLFSPAKEIVRHHHRSYTEWQEQSDQSRMLETQILYLADYLERHIDRDKFILKQVDSLDELMKASTNKLIYQDVVDLYLGESKREEFWLDLTSPRLYSIMLNSGPFARETIGYDHIHSIAELFKNIIDFKSRFTAAHSSGVAQCAVELAGLVGLSEFEIMQLEIAGFLHDLGKLAIPNSILDKPGKLTKDEFAEIRQHTYFTYMVLNSIGGMEQIAEWGAFHHEKLDGSGYPFHVQREKISIHARILVVADIFTALTEDRPYREHMERDPAEKILKEMVEDGAIDGVIVELLIANYDDITASVNIKRDASSKLYNRKVAAARD